MSHVQCKDDKEQNCIYNDSQEHLGNIDVSKPLEQGLMRIRDETFPKVYKATIDFRREMSCLLNNGPECKDAVWSDV
jgi:hypothetical protein